VTSVFLFLLVLIDNKSQKQKIASIFIAFIKGYHGPDLCKGFVYFPVGDCHLPIHYLAPAFGTIWT